MKRSVFATSLLILFSSTVLADIPPPSPHDACQNKKAGDDCLTDVSFFGICKDSQSGLSCKRKTADPVERIKNNKEAVDEKTVTVEEPAKASLSDGEKLDEVTQGCNNISATNSSFSLLGLLSGVLLVVRARRKASL